jgi:thioredoxin 1
MSRVATFDQASFDREVLASEVPVLVNFTMARSAPCEAVEPYVERTADQMEGRLVVGRVDTDSNHELAVRYDVQEVPTLIVFKGGQMVGRLVGFASLNRILELAEWHAI